MEGLDNEKNYLETIFLKEKQLFRYCTIIGNCEYSILVLFGTFE